MLVLILWVSARAPPDPSQAQPLGGRRQSSLAVWGRAARLPRLRGTRAVGPRSHLRGSASWDPCRLLAQRRNNHAHSHPPRRRAGRAPRSAAPSDPPRTEYNNPRPAIRRPHPRNPARPTTCGRPAPGCRGRGVGGWGWGRGDGAAGWCGGSLPDEIAGSGPAEARREPGPVPIPPPPPIGAGMPPPTPPPMPMPPPIGAPVPMPAPVPAGMSTFF